MVWFELQRAVLTLDALDEVAVDGYIDGITQNGNLGVVFNAMGPLAKEYGNGKSAVELTIGKIGLAINAGDRKSRRPGDDADIRRRMAFLVPHP